MTRHRSRPRSKRQLRVGEALRHALADILARGGFRDPELRTLSITVTEVRPSADLKTATAFVTPLGGRDEAGAGPEATARVVRALNRAAAYVRGQLAREIDLKYVPRLAFEADARFEHAARIDALLRDRGGDEMADTDDPAHGT